MTGPILRTLVLAPLCAVALSGCGTLFGKKPAPAPALPPPEIKAEPTPHRPPPPPPPPPAPPRACVPKTLGPPPRYPDTDAALRGAPGAADRYQLMAAGRILRQQRLEELERVVAGCR